MKPMNEPSGAVTSPVDPSSSGAARAAHEAKVLSRAYALMDSLRETHPDFHARIEDANPMLAHRAELIDLMQRAPTDEIYMFLYANFMVRLDIAEITEREFD